MQLLWRHENGFYGYLKLLFSVLLDLWNIPYQFFVVRCPQLSKNNIKFSSMILIICKFAAIKLILFKRIQPFIHYKLFNSSPELQDANSLILLFLTHLVKAVRCCRALMCWWWCISSRHLVSTTYSSVVSAVPQV